MARFSLSSLYALRRAYTGAAENVKLQSTAATMMKKVNAPTAKEAGEGVQKEVFWMKDPKTGDWVPENHFEEISVVELREKLLSKK